MKTKIIIDTDIGDDIDDALAVMLARATEKLEVVGITTTFRNAGKRAQIASRLVRELQWDVPVRKGLSHPLLPNDEEVFLPPQFSDSMAAEAVSEQSATEFIAETVKKYPGEIVLVPIGPLTNIADVLEKHPEIRLMIKRIVLMGGTSDFRDSEWNIQCDPEAARVVLSSGVPVYCVGLNCTLKCVMYREDVRRLTKGTSSLCRTVSGMLARWNDYYSTETPVLHDPLAVACVTENFVTFAPFYVKVILEGEDRAKILPAAEGDPNGGVVYLSQSVDHEAFLDYFSERFAACVR